MSKVGSSVGGIAKCNAEMHSIENGFSLPMWNLVARWGCRGITNTLRLSIANQRNESPNIIHISSVNVEYEYNL